MRSAVKSILLAAAVLSPTADLSAAAFLRSKFVVQDLAPQAISQDLLLHADNNGSAYLYVEQQQGALLAVYDVTDPAHIKLTVSVPTEAHGAYDFVTPIGNTAELVSFRDGSGTALVDLRNHKAPHFSATTPGVIEPLGSSGYLSSSIPQIQPVSTPPRTVQLVEAGRHPRVLASLTNVTRQAERSSTGTVFLLADGKVTVVRRLDAERLYDMDQVADHNFN